MKSLFLTIILLIQYTVSLSQISIGLKAGGQASDIVTRNNRKGFVKDTDPFLSYHFGIFTSIIVDDKLKLIPELQYIKKGFRLNIIDKDDITIESSYIEMPITVSYTPIKMLGIELGPSIGYRISIKESTTTWGPDLERSYNKPFEFGVTGGARIYFLKKFSATARCFYGLSRIETSKYPVGNKTYDSSEHNQNFQFSLYYAIKQ